MSDYKSMKLATKPKELEFYERTQERPRNIFYRTVFEKNGTVPEVCSEEAAAGRGACMRCGLVRFFLFCKVLFGKY